MIDVSVIVVNLNTRELLRQCLASVVSTTSLTLEVIVIDNASSDGSADMVRTEFPDVRLIENKTNEGFARPNNAGMKESRGRYIFLLNSDAALKAEALTRLVAFMDATPDAAACGPRLLYPDGRLQRSVKGFPTLWTHACDMLGLDRLLPNSRLFGKGEMAFFDYDVCTEVDHVMAAAFLVRRKALDVVGLLDEQFRIYYNDMDWCYRMRSAGHKIYYVPTAEVFHHLGSTLGVVNRDFSFFWELHDNTALFHLKHYGRGAVMVYKVMLIVGFIPRACVWSLRLLFAPSPHTQMMCRYSWKTVFYGVQFFKPLSYGTGDNDKA